MPRKWPHRAALALLTMLCIACACAREEPPDRMVDIGTHRLRVRLEGRGLPVVVMETGIGDRARTLQPIAERLGLVTQVCTYDRAGYGDSEPGPLPRDSGRAADELKALLERASLPGPYVIVGHSLGALNLQVFAGRYPRDAAALVLLDPPPLGWLEGEGFPELRARADSMTAEWEALAEGALNSADPVERGEGFFLQAVASEHGQMFGRSAELAGGIDSFGDVPLVVVGAGKPNPAFGEWAEAYQTYWLSESKALARKSSSGRFVLMSESSHNLPADEPDLIVETVLSVVEEVRRRTASTRRGE